QYREMLNDPGTETTVQRRAWSRQDIFRAVRRPTCRGVIRAMRLAIWVASIAHRPTINCHTLDLQMRFGSPGNEEGEAVVEFTLTNEFGFGGTNAALVFRSGRVGPAARVVAQIVPSHDHEESRFLVLPKPLTSHALTPRPSGS